jgi:hypothetical protein
MRAAGQQPCWVQGAAGGARPPTHHHELEQGGLAGAVGPHDGHAAVQVHPQVHVLVKDAVRAVSKRHVTELQYWRRQLAHVVEAQAHHAVLRHLHAAGSSRQSAGTRHVVGAQAPHAARLHLVGARSRQQPASQQGAAKAGARLVQPSVHTAGQDMLLASCRFPPFRSARSWSSCQASSPCSVPASPAWRCRAQSGQCTPAARPTQPQLLPGRLS